jgi:hypothetical protein
VADPQPIRCPMMHPAHQLYMKLLPDDSTIVSCHHCEKGLPTPPVVRITMTKKFPGRPDALANQVKEFTDLSEADQWLTHDSYMTNSNVVKVVWERLS